MTTLWQRYPTSQPKYNQNVTLLQRRVPAGVHLKDELFSWKIAIPILRDISVPTNWNNYKFLSMTQKISEIHVMFYNMTKNPKIYKDIFLVTVLEN